MSTETKTEQATPRPWKAGRLSSEGTVQIEDATGRSVAMVWDFPEAEWLEKAAPEQRQVRREKVGESDVSTVFLGLDHAFGQGSPLIFETMVFGGPLDGRQDRYSTYEQAEAGHAAMVALLTPQPCSCGATEDVTLGPDPYAEDVNNDSTLVWMCASCRYERAQDI